MDDKSDAALRVERTDRPGRGTRADRGGDDGERKPNDRNARGPAGMKVRDEDLEPHEGLRYIARLFKILAILLILLLIGEIVLGIMRQGNAAIPTLLVEATRLIVFAGFLWAAADMALMFIESNHDLRATRILVGRLNARVQDLEVELRGQALTTATPVPAPPLPPRPATGGGARPSDAPPAPGSDAPPGF
ncbi:MAG TPA: hypothetical protein VFH27_08550 [Longimicrobiaceae bacterium]|nr:hypothetical protein [Longimicrobiaceae bacterium]